MDKPSDSELHEIVHRVVQRTLMGSRADTPAGTGKPVQPTASPSPPPASSSSTAPRPPEIVRTVALGADHGGFALKEALKKMLSEDGYNVFDCGAFSSESVDYPDFALAVAAMVSEGKAWRGIIVDGAGIGSCMVANKVPGVRAALCYDHASAINSREHNDANVLTLGAALIGEGLARQIVATWLASEFGGGRHARRVDKIMAIEKQFLKTKD